MSLSIAERIDSATALDICEQRPSTLDGRWPFSHQKATHTRCLPCLRCCRLPFWKRFRRIFLPLFRVEGIGSWHDPDITIGVATLLPQLPTTGPPIRA